MTGKLVVEQFGLSQRGSEPIIRALAGIAQLVERRIRNA